MSPIPGYEIGETIAVQLPMLNYQPANPGQELQTFRTGYSLSELPPLVTTTRSVT
ncbi:MAG: hypothetical protein ACPGXX_17945 [Planctomycetaceae bacterium]